MIVYKWKHISNLIFYASTLIGTSSEIQRVDAIKPTLNVDTEPRKSSRTEKYKTRMQNLSFLSLSAMLILLNQATSSKVQET